MHFRPEKFKQILIIGLMILLVISFSCCTGNDGDDDENGENGGNGGNGNGGNGNNTTNGNNNIQIKEVRQEPPMADMGMEVIIRAIVTSVNPIPYDGAEITICVGEVCYAPETMTEEPKDSGEYIYKYKVPQGDPDLPEIKYTIKITDSLDNTAKKEDIKLVLTPFI